MRALLSLACGGALLAMASAANAVPVSFTTSHTPGGGSVFMSGANPTYSFTLDITTLAAGAFDSATDTLSFAEISFAFADDDDSPAEHVWVTVDGTIFVNNDWANTTYTFDNGSQVTLLSALQADGQLFVEIERQNGDFFFLGSDLVARGERVADNPVPTPEPGTLGVLGVCLAGAWLARRRLPQAA
jgi:hypothetical protein